MLKVAYAGKCIRCGTPARVFRPPLREHEYAHCAKCSLLVILKSAIPPEGISH